jgi:hypothetical protein
MKCKIKNLSVPPSLPDGFVQGLASKDLTNQLRGIGSSIVEYPHTFKVNRSKLVPIALKQPLESGIHQLDRTSPVKNNDSQRAILYERIQIRRLSIQVNSQAVALADFGSHDEAYRG